MGVRGLLLLAALSAALATGCALTMSKERQQKISECLKQCEVSRAGDAPPAPASSYDQRNDCEKRCHQIK